MDKRDQLSLVFGGLMLAILAASCYELVCAIAVWSAVNFQ